MTGLEPHPIFELPTREWVDAHGGRPALEAYLEDRATLMQMEKSEPLTYGFEPAIWHMVDDLLVDGNEVILDLTRIAELSPNGKAPLAVDVPKEIRGAAEVWIGGSQRSSKSEYAGKKCMKVLKARNGRRGWSFADTGPISIARQQPIFWKYMPPEVKKLAAATGKARQGAILNVSYKQKTGFAEQSFVLPNASQHWFKNYEQDIENVEGDQLDVIWLDELRNPMLLKTLRYRMGDRGGIIIVTFTSIDENYNAIVQEYDRGSRTVLEVDAELLPIKRPRISPDSEAHAISVAEAKSAKAEGDKSPTLSRSGVGEVPKNLPAVPVPANDKPNPVYRNVTSEAREGNGRDAVGLTTDSRGGGQNDLATRHGGQAVSPSDGGYEIIGYEKVPRIKVAGPGSDGDQKANIVYFHITDNPYYGFNMDLKPGQRQLSGKERFYKLIKGATRDKILARAYGILTRSTLQQFPKFSDAVHVVEPDRIPKDGTNYLIVDPCDGRNWFMIWVRIDPRGRWYVYREFPSTGHPGAYIPGIGDPGPWTYPGEPADGVRGPAQSPFGFGLERYIQEILRLEGKEEIQERWMDSRYAANPTLTKEGSTTHIEQLAELGMEFLAASGKEIVEGTGLISDKLDYDSETELGKFSATLARLNEPKLFISRNCANTIYSLREWTGKDKQHGACKDPIDVLRYATLAGLDYIGEDAYSWKGGGSY
jgi:hypothetical protein